MDEESDTFDLDTFVQQFPTEQEIQLANSRSRGDFDDETTLIDSFSRFSPQSSTSIRSILNSSRTDPASSNPANDHSKHSRSSHRKLIIAILISICVLAAISGSGVVPPDSGRSNCKQFRSPNGQLTVPQSHRIDIAAHEAIFSDLGDSRFLAKLITIQSNLNISSKAINLDFVGDFACLIKHSPSNVDGDNTSGFLEQVRAVSEQFSWTTSNLTALSNLYNEIALLHSDARGFAAKSVKLGAPHPLDISTPPLFWQIIGQNVFGGEWGFRQRARELLRAADAGMETLEKERSNVYEARSMYQRMELKLQRLITMPRDWSASLDDGSRSTQVWQWLRTQMLDRTGWSKGARGSEESRGDRLKEWLWPGISCFLVDGGEAIQGHRFERWWTDLSCECEP